MALEDSIRGLREFDLNDLDFDNIGAWPGIIKVFICIIVLGTLLALGYYYHIEDLQVELAKVEAEEERLKKDFEKKAFQAANLAAYKQQMAEMEESFGAPNRNAHACPRSPSSCPLPRTGRIPAA